ncbi:MAG TPA: hypothetical protein VLK22_04645 [Candidatus Udaeobacter sp.]|nr:hypothetical protein [Candidatus Udaeobacter sp.]
MNNNRSSSKIWWIVGLISIIFIILIIKAATKPAKIKNNAQLLASCTTDMATQFHIHPYLKIIINSQPQEIPANIGISSECMHAIHTHDNTGKIHVESPEKRDFTLGDFFLIWQKTFNKNQILNYKADAAHIIGETVNGLVVNDYENTILRDNDQIVIYYSEVNP